MPGDGDLPAHTDSERIAPVWNPISWRSPLRSRATLFIDTGLEPPEWVAVAEGQDDGRSPRRSGVIR